jgi:hypothetical protein
MSQRSEFEEETKGVKRLIQWKGIQLIESRQHFAERRRWLCVAEVAAAHSLRSVAVWTRPPHPKTDFTP